MRLDLPDSQFAGQGKDFGLGVGTNTVSVERPVTASTTRENRGDSKPVDELVYVDWPCEMLEINAGPHPLFLFRDLETEAQREAAILEIRNKAWANPELCEAFDAALKAISRQQAARARNAVSITLVSG